MDLGDLRVFRVRGWNTGEHTTDSYPVATPEEGGKLIDILAAGDLNIPDPILDWNSIELEIVEEDGDGGWIGSLGLTQRPGMNLMFGGKPTKGENKMSDFLTEEQKKVIEEIPSHKLKAELARRLEEEQAAERDRRDRVVSYVQEHWEFFQDLVDKGIISPLPKEAERSFYSSDYNWRIEVSCYYNPIT